ncbi:hypothetical protein MNBD_GAMMA26-838 [hydrothermal vent metagenome]|uniref:Uncharacterized protein n=1 Tax=hydrothermal vent metagenome TaxID=652676 RepID=A0A3B1BN78_9ZZZZ
MLEVNAALYMILWELVLVLSAAGVLITVRAVVRSRREQASIDRLVAAVQGDIDCRNEKVRSLLEKKYNYSEEQLEVTVKKITREERRFYQTLVNIFKTRENLLLENLNISFENTIKPYYELEVPGVSVTDGGNEGEGNEEVLRLREENKVLSEELLVTMNTVGRMLNEYSTMFSAPDEDKHDTDALLGMFQETDVNEGDAATPG